MLNKKIPLYKAIHFLEKKAGVKPAIFLFLAAGIFNTIMGFFIFLLFLNLVSYQSAYTISFIIGVISSYILNTRFVFKAQRLLNFKKISTFPLVYVIQYLLGSFLLFIFVGYLELAEKEAIILVAAISFPVTYMLSKKILTDKSLKD